MAKVVFGIKPINKLYYCPVLAGLPFRCFLCFKFLNFKLTDAYLLKYFKTVNFNFLLGIKALREKPTFKSEALVAVLNICLRMYLLF